MAQLERTEDQIFDSANIFQQKTREGIPQWFNQSKFSSIINKSSKGALYNINQNFETIFYKS